MADLTNNSPEFDARISRYNVSRGTPHLATVSSSIAHFGTDMAAPIKSLKVNFLPKQDGTGDPSPNNIRQISGWSSINTIISGKNFANSEILTSSPSMHRLYVVERFMKAGTYYIKCSQVGNELAAYQVGLYVKYNNVGDYSRAGGSNYAINTTKTWTITEDSYVSAYVYGSNMPYSTQFNVMMSNESGALIEPVQRRTISTDWSSVAGTQYGGYIDLISGELVINKFITIIDGTELKAKDLLIVSDESDYVNIRGKYRVILADLPNNAGYNNPYYFKCSHFVWYPYSTRRTMHPDQICWIDTKRNVLWASDTYTTLEEFNQYLVDQYQAGTPVTLAYELTTPTIYQLTPQTLSTLRGINNIYSDANDSVEVKYYTHGDDAYVHIPAETMVTNDNFILLTNDGFALGKEDDYIEY